MCRGSKVICIVGAVVAASGIFLILPASKPSSTDQIEKEAREAMKKYGLLQSGKQWTSPSIWIDKLQGKANSTSYWNEYLQNQSNLLAIGYLDKRSFRLTHFGSWRTIDAEARKRFPDAFIELYSSFENSSITVLAPTTNMPALLQLIHEYDKP